MGIRHMAFEHSCKTVIKTDSVNSDVKDMLLEWYNSDNKVHEESRPQTAGRTMSIDYVDDNTSGDFSQHLACMRNWAYDCTSSAKDETKFTPYIAACLHYFGLMQTFQIDSAILARCVDMMRIRYKATNYHNWTHAFATFQGTFLLLDSPGFKDVLPVEDALGLLLAALGHDVEHPGRNNSFLVNTQSELAFVYNDVSPLENHHASVTCNILQNDNPGLFENNESHIVRRIRQVIVNTILGTDMAKHNDTLKKLDASEDKLPGIRARGERLKADGALLVSQAILHCADIIHPALPWAVHKRMSTWLAEEFFAQYQEEEKLGLPSLPFMGKDPHALVGLAPVQVGFIKFVELPMWAGFNSYVGEDHFGVIIQNIDDNRQRWQKMADTEEIPSDEQEFRPPPNSSDFKSPSLQE